MGRFILVLFVLFAGPNIWANSCCGQSPSSFTVLSLEQRLSLSTSYSFVESQGRVLDGDEFYIWDNKERQIQSLQLNVASGFSEGHQVFVNVSAMRGAYSDNLDSGSSQHLSDAQIGYTYEVLPEYSYSYWKPVVYLSVIANLPTGKSVYDNSQLSEGADVTGHNQWGGGLGLTLRKVYFPLTITFQVKSLRIFSKRFSDVEVSSFYDNSLALLFNYATGFQAMALNFGLTTNQLTERSLSTSQWSSGSMQSTTLLFGVQKAFANSWSAGVNYSDQTLFGRARNTLLNQTYGFNLNYNYF